MLCLMLASAVNKLAVRPRVSVKNILVRRQQLVDLRKGCSDGLHVMLNLLSGNTVLVSNGSEHIKTLRMYTTVPIHM